MSSWAVSSTRLHDAPPNGSRNLGAKGSRLLRLAWQTFSVKCQQLGDLLRREANKPLPKELRRSLRMNKSARRKGYQHYESEADKQRIQDHLNQPINISIRIGPAFDYRPSNY